MLRIVVQEPNRSLEISMLLGSAASHQIRQTYELLEKNRSNDTNLLKFEAFLPTVGVVLSGKTEYKLFL